MGTFQWYFNRLRAMNLPEVFWRINQKHIQQQEKKLFGTKLVDVSNNVWNPHLMKLKFDANALGINWNNSCYGLNTQIHLLQGPDKDNWPNVFSYELNYKQRDDLGDARTNWEKNRHFDWVLLAKAYYVTKDEIVLQELLNKIEVWTDKNPFLYGICWTSAMEFAIRAINWMYALAFVQKAGGDISALRIGTINMVDYLTKHYSRYSSANNHLLVEAAAIGIGGYAFHHQEWKDLALKILTEELNKQNYADGVNKELSLHYQTFGMEAYLLLAHVSGETRWNEMLKKEAEFVAHSSWREKVVCEFGDDDEGKILDLQGGEWHQWEWVLQLASLVTGTRYSSFEHVCENIYWFFDEEAIATIKRQPMYNASLSRSFQDGGNSFLRDKENRVLIGIDHAELGFGTIAAHGHADALSFQILVDGIPVITDPGTYIYHCDLEHRNAFRKTINHSTVCIEGRDQSEMLGAFLWGRKAKCTLEKFVSDEDEDILVARHDGYKPVIHQRKFEWNKKHLILKIRDLMCDKKGRTVNWISTLMLGEHISVVNHTSEVIELKSINNIICVTIQTPIEKVQLEDTEVSTEYGIKRPSKAIRIYGNASVCSIDIELKLQ